MSSDEKKQQNVSSSTIVDLKNELFRKRSEFDYQRVSTSSGQITQKKLHEILKQGGEELRPSSKKPSTAKEKSSPEPTDEPTESDVLAKSRAALERKAALYEKLARGEADTSRPLQEDDDEEGYLVDFDRKVVHEQRRRSPSPPVAAPARDDDEGDDWADYVDSRGVKRRCLKNDLEELRNQQKRIRTEDQLASLSKRTDLLSRDDMRELERQRWEAKARGELQRTSSGDEEEKDDETGFFVSREPVGPLHYSHISSDETRVHGVGYFAFASSEEERQTQMEALNKLHEQTADQRRKSAEVQRRREELKKARLAKVLERRGQQPSTSSSSSVAIDVAETEPATTTIITTEEKSGTQPSSSLPIIGSDLKWPGQREQRPWDKGKNVPSAVGNKNSTAGASWHRAMEERRKERYDEFAPPSSYYHK